jgi:hypothetical protein
VHDRVDAAERIAKGRWVHQVAERNLHTDALLAEAARVAHESAHRLAVRRETPQQGGSHGAGGSREQDHRPTTTTRQGERSLRWDSTSANPASSIQPRISEGVKLRLWLHA